MLPSWLPENVRGKLNGILSKKSDFEEIKKVNTFTNTIGQTLFKKISAEMASNCKFCLVASVDVERSFSASNSFYSELRCFLPYVPVVLSWVFCCACKSWRLYDCMKTPRFISVFKKPKHIVSYRTHYIYFFAFVDIFIFSLSSF